MKKTLPILAKPAPAQTQTELSAKPVAAGSRPTFPKRNDLYRKVGILGSGATAILAGGIATADTPPAGKKAPPPNPVTQQTEPAPPPSKPDPALAMGSVDGKALDLKHAPSFKVYRSGGGIGPPEDMWEAQEVEAFLNYNMAKEGKLAIQSNYKFDFDGVSVTLQGYDPVKKVGYAYADKMEDGSAFTKEVTTKLADWQKSKKVAILFIDQKKSPDQATLKGKVVKFLAAVKKAPPADGPLQ
jgi:hypothetical protein